MNIEETVIKKEAPKKETKPKKPKEPKAKSESTESKKKKKSNDPEEQEDEGPDEYDMTDSFIDNTRFDSESKRKHNMLIIILF